MGALEGQDPSSLGCTEAPELDGLLDGMGLAGVPTPPGRAPTYFLYAPTQSLVMACCACAKVMVPLTRKVVQFILQIILDMGVEGLGKEALRP